MVRWAFSQLLTVGHSSPQGIQESHACCILRFGLGSKTKGKGEFIPTKMTAIKHNNEGATTGYEAELWAMADTLRGSMDAAEYKHVVLGLIFLKYISDAFEERHEAVLTEWGGEAAEDRDEYIAENIFWVPQEARWTYLQAQARQSTIGQTVDKAMAAIERDNPALKDVLPKDHARPALDKQRLGQAHRHDRKHPRRGCGSPLA